MTGNDLGASHDEWYGALEAARFLGIHRSTLHIAVRQRLLVPDSRTPGGHLRFSRQTLEAYRARIAGGTATGEEGVFARMHGLAEIAHLVAEQTSFDEIGQAAVASIRRALAEVEMIFIAVRDYASRDRYALHIVAQEGIPQIVFTHYAQLRTTFRFATTSVMRSLRPEVCFDTAHEPIHSGTARLCKDIPIGAYAAQPIVHGQEALGVVICASAHPREFNAQDLAFLGGISDLLATAIRITEGVERLEQFHEHLDAARELTQEALLLRLRGLETDAIEEAVAYEQAVERGRQLGQLFQRLSGATTVCALGFGADLRTQDMRLQELACQSCARTDHGYVIAHNNWQEDGATYTGIGACVPLEHGSVGGVSAAWQGTRPLIEADYALLTTFASAYLTATAL